MNAEIFKARRLHPHSLEPHARRSARARQRQSRFFKEANKPFHFILTRVRANLRNNNSAAMALEALGLVLPVRMHERVMYAETFAHGKTALDIEPHSHAGQELAELWQSVKGVVQ